MSEAPSIMSDDRPGTPAVETHAPVQTEGDADTLTSRRAILVVDADRAEAERAARILGDAGYPVTAATSSRSALRQVFASSVAPGLLVCSIEMPEMSGIELAARLTAARPGMRVLLLAVDPASIDRARDHSSLVHGALLKPFTSDGLREAVAVALADEP
jgi:CheY-like chemotaxis protein